MMNKRIDHISLPDREEVDVHRIGDPKAPVVLYNHGLPASGEEMNVVLADLDAHGLQGVSATRGGYGNSTAKKYKTLDQITEDQLRILDALGIREVYTVGTSAGAKGALALANREPDRVTGVSILASLPPISDEAARLHLPLGTRVGLTAAASIPTLTHRLFTWLVGFEVSKARRNPAQAIRNYITILPAADQAVLSEPTMFEAFVNIVRDWSKSGTGHGLFGDMVRAGQEWGFDPKDVMKDVQIIHGGLDPVVPLKSAAAFGKIPNRGVTVILEGGHAIYAYKQVSDDVIARVKKVLGQ